MTIKANFLRVVPALLGIAVVSPAQAETRAAVYVTSRACQADDLLTFDQCRNAFANAEAEFYDNVPVFERQDACEKQFRRCMISFAEPPDPEALRYSPTMRGVQVTVTSTRERTVVPVMEARHPAISFSPRTVLTRQDGRSPERQEEARARWATFQAAAAGESTLALRGSLDGHPARCRPFCPKGASGVARPSAPPSLFAPRLDGGSRSYEALDTGRFVQPRAPLEDGLPRFVR